MEWETDMSKTGVPGDPFSIETTARSRVRIRETALPGRCDPYGGRFSATRPARKRDLRKVEEWLEARRRAEAQRQEEEALARQKP